MALENETETLKKQLRTVYLVNSFMLSATNKNKLLQLIMEESKQVVNAEASSLILYDEESDGLFFELVLGDKSGKVKEVRLDMGVGIAGIAAQNRETVNVRDVKKDHRYYKQVDEKSNFQTRCILAVPLMRNEKLIGVVEVLNKIGKPHFDEEDITIMEILANQAAIAIENARLVEEKTRSEKLAAIGEAIAGTAHYIKNILDGLQSGMNIMDIALKERNWEFLEKSWPIYKRSSLKISKLVNNMLMYSKDRVLVKSPENIVEIIENTVELMEHRAKIAGIRFHMEYEHEDTEINLDGGAIGDAILNLITNSIDANDKLEGTIRIATGITEDDQFKITFSDNGRGMPQELMDKIFKPFFSTKGSKGTGLGLAVTKKVIEEHDGRIEVESTPGRGTTFQIYLPLAPVST